MTKYVVFDGQDSSRYETFLHSGDFVAREYHPSSKSWQMTDDFWKAVSLISQDAGGERYAEDRYEVVTATEFEMMTQPDDEEAEQ